MTHRVIAYSDQQGAALLISLVILLVLTVLAVSSMQGTALQERMVAAQRDAQLALEGAEHALQEAEQLLNSAPLPIFNNNNGLFTVTGSAPAGSILHAAATWSSSANSREASMPVLDGENMLAEAPRFFIQVLPATAISVNQEMPLNMGGYGAGDGEEIQVTAYRIVARSTGRTGQTPRIIEAHVFR